MSTKKTPVDMSKIRRHGDVLLKPISADMIPKDGTKTVSNSYVLAEGEATGHRHVLALAAVEGEAKTEVNGMEFITGADGTLYMTIHAPAEITHEEHGTIQVEPGTYQVVIEKEDALFEERRFNVAD
jgi:hypothetical protein